MGYKPQMLHGDIYYCRREIRVGTRFDSVTCGTPADIDALTTAGQDKMKDIQRHDAYQTK